MKKKLREHTINSRGSDIFLHSGTEQVNERDCREIPRAGPPTHTQRRARESTRETARAGDYAPGNRHLADFATVCLGIEKAIIVQRGILGPQRLASKIASLTRRNLFGAEVMYEPHMDLRLDMDCRRGSALGRRPINGTLFRTGKAMFFT